VRRARQRDAGLTLVELMITIILASLVTTATFAFFSGQQMVYDTQSKLLTTQQNVWSSIEVVSRYLRSAGGGMFGCVRPDSDGAGSDTGDPGPGSAATPLTGIRAFRSGTGVIRIPPLWIQNGAAGAPDTLTVAYGSGASGTFSDATLGAAVTQPLDPITTLPGQSVRFLTGEFILLVDRAQANGDRGCTMFQVTGTVPLSNTLVRATTSVWNPGTNVANFVPFTYPGGVTTSTGGIRTFGQLTWVQFAIDRTGAPAVPPRLTMNRLDGTNGPEVLADGIEDMQIAYACDLAGGGADGVLAEGTDSATRAVDEWTYNEPGEAVQAGCIRPDAVRITLIGRSLTVDNLLFNVPGNAKPAAEDGAAGATDQYRHRVATASIYPRN
jgi:hypothetical protein